ncbi:MAG TPA: hypothetical protein VJ123_00370 [Anaerolineales bacterium]|nr:hypothetical protein [Anaerolineales bacterium]
MPSEPNFRRMSELIALLLLALALVACTARRLLVTAGEGVIRVWGIPPGP